MGELIIRELDEALLLELKRRAWERGLSPQELLRRILRAGLEIDHNVAPRAFLKAKAYSHAAGRNEPVEAAL